MIDLMPNMTFFVQMGIFLFTLIFMNVLIFRPVLRLIERRREVTEGYRAQAAGLQDQTEALVARYEAQMKTAREEGLSLKGELTKKGEEEARMVLAQARKDLEARIEGNRQALASDAKEAQLALRKYSRELSHAMAEKLLGRKVPA